MVQGTNESNCNTVPSELPARKGVFDALVRCRQERLGKLLHLEEAAEDWADAAAVPVELVLSLGQARFGIQATEFCGTATVGRFRRNL